MPLYESLVRGTQKGHEEIRDVGKRFEDVKKWVQGADGKILSSYALFGRYDYLAIMEFPSEKQAARVLTKIASRGTANFETMTAMPMNEFIKIAQEV